MTLGEKIREARRKCGLSQEQLAKKMTVSRSAIAKWETDKGLPDVVNLKILARLLSVSVDYLLDEAEAANQMLFRESYDLTAYGHGCSKIKKDRAVREKFPDAKIYPLFGRQEPSDSKPSAPNTLTCHSNIQSLSKNADKSFYLIEKDSHQLLVTLTDNFIEIQPLEEPVQGSSFFIDGWSFIRHNYEIGI